jgi:primase-polymerase (primpol)-like protein
MTELPAALVPLSAYKQFIVYKIVQRPGEKAKKVPLNPHTLRAFEKGADWQQRPELWADAATVARITSTCGPSFGIGFLLTSADPFFFVDIDGAWDGQRWSDVAAELCQRLSGAAVEVSQSGTGLHIIGTGAPPAHGCKNTALGLEFYHEARFIALTGTNAVGNAALDCTALLPELIGRYFTPGVERAKGDWTTEPVADWSGPEDDTELLARMFNAKSAAATAFGKGASLADLWTANAEALSRAYPDITGEQHRAYDASQADAALAQHLAFWTGRNCERMQRLMFLSALVREKWDRVDYIEDTIQRAADLQETVYRDKTDTAAAESLGAPKLRASSEAQREFANSIRDEKLRACASDPELREFLAQKGVTAKFWIENRGKGPEELGAALTPISELSATGPIRGGEAVRVEGYQFMGLDLQLEYFRGCVYIQDLHAIYTPSGTTLKEGQFNATYGGYVFQMDALDATSKQPWDVFTKSQAIRFPKAETGCFRPEETPGAIINIEGRQAVNLFSPVATRVVDADPAPFLNHLAKLLPGQRDREILLAYMAACVQFPGVKFQWAPLIQGVEGNGKTLFSRCVAAALGEKYTHYPIAAEIGEKFNEWLFNKLFIGIEDVFIPDHKLELIEALKPMITNDRLAMRAMQRAQVMGDNRANFILNCNDKGAMRKSRNDRRFAPFYTAQQAKEDLARDGMEGDYFPDLYGWLEGKGRYLELGAGYGYAVVTHLLKTYDIPDELNPAGVCIRAPLTSSTDEAVSMSMGPVEQEIQEAIEEGRPGFAGGWVSSHAVDKLLSNMKADRRIPRRKRRELLENLGFIYHPALNEGRAGSRTATDGGRPRLYIQAGHILATTAVEPADVVRMYDQAQTAAALT